MTAGRYTGGNRNKYSRDIFVGGEHRRPVVEFLQPSQAHVLGMCLFIDGKFVLVKIARHYTIFMLIAVRLCGKNALCQLWQYHSGSQIKFFFDRRLEI